MELIQEYILIQETKKFDKRLQTFKQMLSDLNGKHVLLAAPRKSSKNGIYMAYLEHLLNKS